MRILEDNRIPAGQEKNWKIVRVRTCVRAGMIFLGVLGMQMVAAIVLGLLVSLRALLQSDGYRELADSLSASARDTAQYTVLLSLLCAVGSGVWCGILYYRSDWRERPFDYRKALPVRVICLIAATVAGSCILFSDVLSVIQLLFPKFFDTYNQLMDTISTADAFLSLLYVVIVGPVSEELIFRGAIQDRFYLVFPFWTANILQAAHFGVYHMNVIQGLYAFCLGVLLGMIRQMTGSILSSIFSHMVFNATSFAYSWAVAQAGTHLGVFVGGSLLVSIVAVAVGVKFIGRACRRKI